MVYSWIRYYSMVEKGWGGKDVERENVGESEREKMRDVEKQRNSES